MNAQVEALFSLEKKVAVVTGSLGLLGQEHCKVLASAGAHVVVTDLDEAACQTFADKLPTQSLGLGVDVSNKESLEQALNQVMARFDRVDVLVNNAALNDRVEDPEQLGEITKFENFSEERWRRTVDVNLTGVFLGCQVFGSQMARQQSGSIVNVGSTYGMGAPDPALYRSPEGKQNMYKSPAYGATKAGVYSLTQYLSAYWGPVGVRVNCLSPGGVKNAQDPYFMEQYSRRTTLGRMAEPTDYWGALLFLSSPASSYMSGANLVVDGGWTAW